MGRGGKGFPANGLELPPHLVQVDALEVALGDSHDVGHVIPKGQLCKVGQGFLVANCNIDELYGDACAAGTTTPTAVQWWRMQTLQLPAGSC